MSKARDPLVQAAVDGDELALDQLMIICNPAIESGVRRGTSKAVDVEDAKSLTKALIVRKFHTFNETTERQACAWMKTTAYRKGLALSEREARHYVDRVDLGGAAEAVLVAHESGDVDRYLTRHLVEGALAAVREIDPDAATVVEMKSLQDCSNDQIAAEIGRSAASIRGIHARGIRLLRQILNGEL